jgi:DNA polymerase (family 10)
MPIHNTDIAKIFNQTADLLEIKGENPFRIRAYRNAARTIQSLPKSITELLSNQEDLTQYSGIGKDLAKKIKEINKTGSFVLLEKLKEKVPAELAVLMKIQGLGPKRISKFYKELDISSLDDLREALDDGEIRKLEGFGEKTEHNICQQINRLEKQPQQRTKLSEVEQIARSLVQYLKKAKGVKQIEVAGSFRRRKATVRDLDILATCKRSSDIMDHFTSYEDVQKALSKGKTKTSVLLKSGFQVDLRVVPQVSYGAALVYFTGSKEHNIEIRKIANRKKMKINEYGVFKADTRAAGKTEQAVYKKVKLPWIPPELRENRGEIQAAQQGELPELITLEDIQGDLHVHSNYTDGSQSIEEMARVAQEKGYQYIAITDHSRHLAVAGGLKPKELRKQLEEIDKINETLKGFTILKGCEVDILEDGKLDLPDEALKELDIRVCSIHYKFNLSKKKQTKRILRAMKNPLFDILGHPTGRLINERSPYDLDIKDIFKAAKDNGCIVELNAHPDRLDLNDSYCKMAKDIGVQIVISTDAHQTEHLNYMRYGIDQARRGWLEAKNVINTRSLDSLRKLLARS